MFLHPPISSTCQIQFILIDPHVIMASYDQTTGRMDGIRVWMDVPFFTSLLTSEKGRMHKCTDPALSDTIEILGFNIQTCASK